MEQDPKQTQTEEKETPQFRGLYRHVKISVKTLDIIIIACIAVIVIFLAIDLQNPGFTITFDSKGGTDVPAQNQMYGELLEVPQPPTREGYVFAGWGKDAACFEFWREDTDTVQSDLTLYAAWEPK